MMGPSLDYHKVSCIYDAIHFAVVMFKGLAESVHDLEVLDSILATLEVLNENLLIKNCLVSARSGKGLPAAWGDNRLK